jgi:hypothetical protein
MLQLWRTSEYRSWNSLYIWVTVWGNLLTNGLFLNEKEIGNPIYLSIKTPALQTKFTLQRTTQYLLWPL